MLPPRLPKTKTHQERRTVSKPHSWCTICGSLLCLRNIAPTLRSEVLRTHFCICTLCANSFYILYTFPVSLFVNPYHCLTTWGDQAHAHICLQYCLVRFFCQFPNVCLERLDVPASAPEIVLGTSPCFYADRSSVFSPDGGSTAAQRLQVQAVVAAVQARGRRWEPEVSSLPCSSSGKEATSAFASASGRWANYFMGRRTSKNLSSMSK